MTKKRKQPSKKREESLAAWHRGYFTNESYYIPNTASGKVVDVDNSLGIAAFFCGIKLLSEVQPSKTIDVYIRQGRNKQQAESHPLYKMMQRGLNTLQTPKMFWQQICMHQMLWGFSICPIRWNPVNGNLRSISILEPWRVRPYLDEDDGELMFDVDGGQSTLHSDDVLYFPHMSMDGVHGKSIIAYARESLGHALATQEYGAKLFGNGGRPSSVLKHPAALRPETKNSIKNDWKSFNDNGGLLVLPEGMDYMPIGMPPEDAQFLQTRQFQVTEIAQWLNLPPHMLKDMTGAKYNNIEHQAIEFITYTMMPKLVEFEQELNRKLLPDTHFCKYDVAALLRGDLAAQSAWYREMHNIGVFTVNEIREQIDWNTIGTDGDYRFVNSTMISIERAVNPPEPAPQPQAQPEPPDEEDDNANQ